MSSYTTTLARRGLQVAHASFIKRAEDGDENVPIPASAVFMLLLTSLLFFGLIFSISYTYGNVVTTLCMVEETQTNAYIPVDITAPEESAPPAYSAASDDSVPKPNAPAPTSHNIEIDDLLLVRSKPITSSLRGTVAHLRARAGYWSQFRGLSLFLVYNMVRNLAVSGFAALFGIHAHGRFRSHAGVAFATILAEICLSRYAMTWVHIVISEPSPKPWYRRVPPLYTLPRIIPVVAVYAVTTQAAHLFPLLVIQSFGSLKHMREDDFEPTRNDLIAIFGQSIMGIFLVLGLFVLLVIPATVTLVRVSASMLPDEDETIVPFDRTFGGKVTPALVGGSGRIGMVEAWRSFPWASRKRLLKLIAKVFLLMFATWMVLSITIIVEAQLLLGDKLGEVMKTVHKHIGPR